jgi:hypothetical protein
MSKRVDMAAVRASRARLAKLAVEHPELVGASGEDNIQAWERTLEDALVEPKSKDSTAKERMTRLRARRRDAGVREVQLWLDPATLARVDRLKTAEETWTEFLRRALDALEQVARKRR